MGRSFPDQLDASSLTSSMVMVGAPLERWSCSCKLVFFSGGFNAQGGWQVPLRQAYHVLGASALRPTKKQASARKRCKTSGRWLHACLQ